jgi:hypothetical protein
LPWVAPEPVVEAPVAEPAATTSKSTT